jgi:hypothetical protein
MGYYDELLSMVQIPKMARITLEFDRRKVENIPDVVAREIQNCKCIGQVRGKRVAIAVGSRGIKNLPEIVHATVKSLQESGAQVFIVPAMGSHGGAVAEGQRKLLNHLGVSEETMGVPICASMEVVVIGTTEDGVPVYFDKLASEADFTVSIARIKPHTSFRGPYESGMVKMNVIGLGKQKGADYCHIKGMQNMGENLKKIGTISVRNSNLLFSLGLIENGYDDTFLIKVIPKDEILETETEMLNIARSLLPYIPFKELDLLIIDEIGKNISGTGMECNIVQRFTSEHMPAKPFIKRIVVLDLTDESDGNAAGAGLADISTQRLFNKVVFTKTYPNSLTARTTIPSKLPIIMDNDLTAIKAGIKTAPDVDYDNMRIVRIKNTLEMDKMEISEALFKEAVDISGVKICSEPRKWCFDDEGNLL